MESVKFNQASGYINLERCFLCKSFHFFVCFSYCVQLLHSVIALSHFTSQSLHSAIALSHCTQSLHSVIALSHFTSQSLRSVISPLSYCTQCSHSAVAIRGEGPEQGGTEVLGGKWPNQSSGHDRTVDNLSYV